MHSPLSVHFRLPRSLSISNLPEAGPDRYGSRFSFSETAFALEGWIRSHDSDGRFDEEDPLCLGISRTRFMPFEHCEGPTLAGDGVLIWPPTQGITFSYERWKDRRDLTDRDYEGPEIRTFGSRLYAKAKDIFSFLKTHKRDLIMEIRISRKRGGSRYQTRKEEKSIELEEDVPAEQAGRRLSKSSTAMLATVRAWLSRTIQAIEAVSAVLDALQVASVKSKGERREGQEANGTPSGRKQAAKILSRRIPKKRAHSRRRRENRKSKP